MVKLKSFSPFSSTTEAVVAATSIIDSTLDKTLKKFLKKNILSKENADELAVADIKLGGLIKEKLDIKCVCNDSILELFRGCASASNYAVYKRGDYNCFLQAFAV